jgi:beta-mannosidase
MGTLYWQLNDTWPCASWSSLDYGGGWKLSHHMARRFYAPLRVVVVPRADGWALRGVNDQPQATGLSLEVFAVDMAGTSRRLAATTAEVPTGMATELAWVPADAIGQGELLLYRWTSEAGDAGEEHFAPSPYKVYDLLPPRIRTDLAPTEGGWELTLAAEALALFVAIEAEGARPSDNCFALLPGCPRRLHLASDAMTSMHAPTFTIRNLHGATYS